MNTIAYKPTTNSNKEMMEKTNPDSWKAIIEFDSLDEVLALYHALNDAIDEHFKDARNKHVWALGANTQEESLYYEALAEHQRKHGYKLMNIKNELEKAFHCSEYYFEGGENK